MNVLGRNRGVGKGVGEDEINSNDHGDIRLSGNPWIEANLPRRVQSEV